MLIIEAYHTAILGIKETKKYDIYYQLASPTLIHSNLLYLNYYSSDIHFWIHLDHWCDIKW